jgi:hypothetical protein
MSFRNMSDQHPMDEFKDRCNDRCNAIWKHMERLSEYINTLPKGQSKEYLEQYKSTLGMIAELYFSNAVSIGHIRGMEEGQVKALFQEVFKDREITLPYEPKKDETLSDIARRYKEKEPLLEWIDRFLKERAKDTEKR